MVKMSKLEMIGNVKAWIEDDLEFEGDTIGIKDLNIEGETLTITTYNTGQRNELQDLMRQMAEDERINVTVDGEGPDYYVNINLGQGIKLTAKSHELFMAYAEDAGNWQGTPLVGGNVGGSKSDSGNLLDLKKKGLVTTEQDEENRACQWLYFTDEGKAYARLHGVDLNQFDW